MNELKKIRLKIWKIQRDIASLNWKKRNPDKVKNYQDNYRKIHAEELAKKARLKRKFHGNEINARRRELYATKTNTVEVIT